MPTELTALGDAVFLSANDGVDGFELWRAQNGIGGRPRCATSIPGRRARAGGAGGGERRALLQRRRRDARRRAVAQRRQRPDGAARQSGQRRRRRPARFRRADRPRRHGAVRAPTTACTGSSCGRAAATRGEHAPGEGHQSRPAALSRSSSSSSRSATRCCSPPTTASTARSCGAATAARPAPRWSPTSPAGPASSGRARAHAGRRARSSSPPTRAASARSCGRPTARRRARRRSPTSIPDRPAHRRALLTAVGERVVLHRRRRRCTAPSCGSATVRRAARIWSRTSARRQRLSGRRRVLPRRRRRDALLHRRRRRARHRAVEERRHGGGHGAGARHQSRAGAIRSPAFLRNVDGTLFFVADDGVHGARAVDAATAREAGTQMVADINPTAARSAPSRSSSRSPISAAQLFFAADDGTHGAELWRSDGSAAGTALVADINPGEDGSFPAFLTAPATASSSRRASRDSGLRGVADRRAGDAAASPTSCPGRESSNPGPFTASGGSVFFSADTPATGTELWAPGVLQRRLRRRAAR